MSDDTKGRQYRPPAFVSGHAALEQEAREGQEAKRALRGCLEALERAHHLVCSGDAIGCAVVLAEEIGRVREAIGE